jgi:hypothetical protein
MDNWRLGNAAHVVMFIVLCMLRFPRQHFAWCADQMFFTAVVIQCTVHN